MRWRKGSEPHAEKDGILTQSYQGLTMDLSCHLSSVDVKDGSCA